jgi:DNA mismatch repair protein MutS
MAYELAALDALQSLANAAERGGYVKPAVSGGGSVVIKEGRHPVVEQLTGHAFVPNDTDIDGKSRRLSIITGPNMAGKSTYMRQVALIVLMAQIGSFVPASSAKIGVVDRIFTRVGASDDLATGQSTFMVEMTEVANILHNATARSLVLLDEIGRGTSTFDGLSIAWAVLEHIAANVGAKTLFATHYHELTELEGAVSGVVNYCFTVREQGEEVVFLRKLTRGGADHSFGIHVARLAGLPETVLARARTVLSALNEADIAKNTEKLRAQGKRAGDGEAGGALPEENTAEETARKNAALAEALKRIDIDRTTPLEAIVELERLHKMIES